MEEMGKYLDILQMNRLNIVIPDGFTNTSAYTF